jgi:hypothetical protein
MRNSTSATRLNTLPGPLDRLPPAERRFLQRLFRKIRGHLSEPGRSSNAKFTSEEMLCLFPEFEAQLFEAASNPDHPSNRVLQSGALCFKNVNDNDGNDLVKPSAGVSAHSVQNSKTPTKRITRKSSSETPIAIR